MLEKVCYYLYHKIIFMLSRTNHANWDFSEHVYIMLDPYNVIINEVHFVDQIGKGIRITRRAALEKLYPDVDYRQNVAEKMKHKSTNR